MNVQSETCNFESLLRPLLSSSQVSGEMLADSLLAHLNEFSTILLEGDYSSLLYIASY